MTISKDVWNGVPPHSPCRWVQKTAPVVIRGLALLLVAILAAAQQPQTAPTATIRQAGELDLHRPVERDLGPGQADLFTVEAAAGQFLHVVADQKGLDVLLRIVDPEGKVLVTADRPSGAFGREAISAITQQSALLQIKVEMSPGTSEAGQYTIELTDMRDPTEKDRLRIDAETKLFAAIAEGHTTDAANRRKAIELYSEAASLWHNLQAATNRRCAYTT